MISSFPSFGSGHREAAGVSGKTCRASALSLKRKASSARVIADCCNMDLDTAKRLLAVCKREEVVESAVLDLQNERAVDPITGKPPKIAR